MLAGDSKSSEPPRPLWSQDLNDSNADSVKNLKTKPQPVAQPFGQSPFAIYSPQVGVNTIGAITDRYVCFQRFRNLVAVDPLSGEPLWVRREIPQGSKVFGDDQFVFVLPPEESRVAAAKGIAAAKTNERDAMVFRATDGQLLGTRKVPNVIFSGDNASSQVIIRRAFAMNVFAANRIVVANGAADTPISDVCLAVFGRNLLIWRSDGKEGEMVLELFDPWEQRAVWGTRTFAPKRHPRWWHTKLSPSWNPTAISCSWEFPMAAPSPI